MASAMQLSSEEEAEFQNWIRALPWFSEFVEHFGEEPDLDIQDYDYRGAWKAGLSPSRYEHDNNRYHWPSQFKSPDHPTMWMEDFMRATGKDPNELGLKSKEEGVAYLDIIGKGQQKNHGLLLGPESGQYFAEE